MSSRSDLLLNGTPRLIVSAQHRFADRSWINVAELRDEAWIVGEADRSGPQFGPWPTLDGELTVVHSLRDWPARLGLVAAGLGVAVIPSVLVPALPPGVRAVRVEDPRPFHRDVLAVTMPGRSPSIDAVIGALHTEAGRLGWPPRSLDQPAPQCTRRTTGLGWVRGGRRGGRE